MRSSISNFKKIIFEYVSPSPKDFYESDEEEIVENNRKYNAYISKVSKLYKKMNYNLEWR